MTTIVATRNAIAADTQASYSGLKSNMTKIFATKRGLVGFAGVAVEGIQFVEWMRDRRKAKPDMKDTSALVVTPDGEIIAYEESLTPVPVRDDYYAIGSGAYAALACFHTLLKLELVLDPTLAIEVAKLIDDGTGGDTDVLTLQ